MHLKIVDDLTKQYRQSILKGRLIFSSVSAFSAILAAVSVTLGLPLEMIGAIVVGGGGVSAGTYYWHDKTQSEVSNSLISNDVIVQSYRNIYNRRILEKDEFTSSLWTRIHDHLVLGLSAVELRSLEKVKPSDLKGYFHLLGWNRLYFD